MGVGEGEERTRAGAAGSRFRGRAGRERKLNQSVAGGRALWLRGGELDGGAAAWAWGGLGGAGWPWAGGSWGSCGSSGGTGEFWGGAAEVGGA